MTYKRGKRGGAKQRAKQQAAVENKQDGNSTEETAKDEKEESEVDTDMKMDDASSELDNSQDLDESKTEEDSKDKKDGADGSKGQEGEGQKDETGAEKKIVPLMEVDISRYRVADIPPFVVEHVRGKSYKTKR